MEKANPFRVFPSIRLFLLAVLILATPLFAGEPLSVENPPEEVFPGEDTPLSGMDADALLQLLAGEEENRSAAISALIELRDPALYGFLENLYKGNVYFIADPNAGAASAAQGGGDSSSSMGLSTLVIAGPSIEQGDQTLYPLFTPYPLSQLKDASGRQTLVEYEQLIEVETDRELRARIQPYLTAMDLHSPLTSKRKAAAMDLGASGDTLNIGILRAAKVGERDPIVLHLLTEAIFRLDLLSLNPLRRALAVHGLGEIHAVNVVPELTALITPGEGGRFPEPEPAVRQEIRVALDKISGWNRMMSVVQNLFSGISLGSILILMALGLAVIFGLMGVINMAHGEFMMIGAYATFLVQHAFIRFLPESMFEYFFAASFPMAFLLAGSIGFLVEFTIVKRLYGRPLETLLATWGVSLLLIQSARSIFGDLTSVTSPAFLSRGWEISPQVVLPYNRIFIIFLTLFVVTGMSLIFYRTSLGTKIRAVTQNRAMSSCLGIPTRRIDGLTFALGTGIAGIAGCALTQIGNVDPGMGQNYIVDSFMVVVTGGVGKLAGMVISGLGIGALNKFLEPFFQAVYAKVILLAAVILFLQARPSGLFPAKGRHEE